MGPVYDVAVIGAGLVGAAIARELLGYDLSVALIESRDDVGDGTSKANTAILHTGFDAPVGTLESRLVRRGHALLSRYAVQTGIPLERTGALLVAWTSEELDSLAYLKAKAEQNGYQHCAILDRAEVYRRVPALGVGALGGLTVPDESIICTWTTNLAFATEARLRGAELLLRHRVEAVDIAEEITTITTSGSEVRARWVINAAGLGCDLVDRLFGYDRFTVTPRRGELLVFDKFARPLANTIVLPVPSKLGKGVLISPTIYGNVMLGPTAQDLTDRAGTGTTAAGIALLLSKGQKLMPLLLKEEVTATYAGLRAAIDSSDYLIEVSRDQRYVLVGGIRSTGLTASMAIAEYVREMLGQTGLQLIPKSTLPPAVRMPNLGEAFARPYQNSARIEQDSAYGQIICFCERVTSGEIRDCLQSVIPPVTIDGIRRRTRAMNGRCQGFFCGAEIESLLGMQATVAAEQQ